MKNKKIISVLLLLTLVLTSCNKVDNSANINKDTTAQEEQIVNENAETLEKEDGQNLNDNKRDNTISEENSSELIDPPADKIYDIVDKKYDSYGLHIAYPQITNLNDKDKQNKINDMIKLEALIAIHFYANDDGTSRIENANFEVNYAIKFESENIFSLIFSGKQDDKGLKQPLNHLYTLNIDMNNCTKLKLSDLVTVDEKFIEKFRKGKLTEPPKGLGYEGYNYFINDDLTGANVEYLLKCFKASDSSYNKSPFTFSYITKDGLVISTENRHGYGDHIEIKLKYEDIKDNIKSDSIIWEAILHSVK